MTDPFEAACAELYWSSDGRVSLERAAQWGREYGQREVNNKAIKAVLDSADEAIKQRDEARAELVEIKESRRSYELELDELRAELAEAKREMAHTQSIWPTGIGNLKAMYDLLRAERDAALEELAEAKWAIESALKLAELEAKLNKGGGA